MCFGQLSSGLAGVLDGGNVSTDFGAGVQHLVRMDKEFYALIRKIETAQQSQRPQVEVESAIHPNLVAESNLEFSNMAPESHLETRSDREAKAANVVQEICTESAQKTVAPKFKSKTNFDDTKFRCSIYSMANAIPETEDDPLPSTVKRPLPGELLYDEITNFKVVDSNGKPMDIPSVNKCREGFFQMWNLLQYFGRNSLDGLGMEIVAVVYVGWNLENASWSGGLSGPNIMLFGDGGRGRGQIYLEMSGSKEDRARLEKIFRTGHGIYNTGCFYEIEILGHEITHALVQYTAGLGSPLPEVNPDLKTFRLQAAALEESISDCFGMMLKHKTLGITVDQSDWDICPTAFISIFLQYKKWTKGYMRTFRIPDATEKPGKKEPKHMREFDESTTITDGHYFAGIPNHAFYVAAKEFNGHSCYSWETVGKIWYNALTDIEFTKASNRTFEGWAALTTSHAIKLFGNNGAAILPRAWRAVGIDVKV
jgi:Thermolysin metallopeptidase, alpha-helical domain/Thermolysin metallopeptidase, catalytic domain